MLYASSGSATTPPPLVNFSPSMDGIFFDDKHPHLWIFDKDSIRCEPNFYSGGDDKVNHPSHYTGGKVECIDAMCEVFGSKAVQYFALLNTFKYLWRYKDKNGDEDVEKAKWYFSKYKELVNDGLST